MDSITFNCEVITPLFLSGADSKTPELRPPSIRGAMRWWFRAMMGGIVGDNIKTLYELESKIFGDTKTTSKFSLRCDSSKAIKQTRDEVEAGTFYLGFIFYKWDKEEYKYFSIRDFYRVGSEIGLKLNYNYSITILQKKIIEDTLWLLINMGGVGARTRRGFGGLKIKHANTNIHSKILFILPNELNKIIDYFYKNLKIITEDFKQFADEHGKKVIDFANGEKPKALFSSFQNWKTKFITKSDWIISDKENTWKEVLNDVGNFLREFRVDVSSSKRRTADYLNVVSDFLYCKFDSRKDFEGDLKNDIFGLPIQYRSSSQSRSLPKGKSVSAITVAQILEKDKLKEIDRRSSPLLIRPLIFGNQYVIAFTLFEAQFLPLNANQILKPVERSWPDSKLKPNPIKIKNADYIRLHNEFFNKLDNNFSILGELS